MVNEQLEDSLRREIDIKRLGFLRRSSNALIGSIRNSASCSPSVLSPSHVTGRCEGSVNEGRARSETVGS